MKKYVAVIIGITFLFGCENKNTENYYILNPVPSMCEADKRELGNLLSQNAHSSKEKARLRQLSIKFGRTIIRKKPKEPFYKEFNRPNEFERAPNTNFNYNELCR